MQKGAESDGIPYIREEGHPEGEDGSDLEGRHHSEKARRAAGFFSLHYITPMVINDQSSYAVSTRFPFLSRIRPCLSCPSPGPLVDS